jgi:hypothetical protein
VFAVPDVNDFVTQVVYLLTKERKPRVFSLKDKEAHLFNLSGLIPRSLLRNLFCC